jgi:hypothetical protein
MYPKLTEHIEQNNYSQGPIMEIYDTPNEKILYVASVNMNATIFDDFLKEAIFWLTYMQDTTMLVHQYKETFYKFFYMGDNSRQCICVEEKEKS